MANRHRSLSVICVLAKKYDINVKGGYSGVASNTFVVKPKKRLLPSFTKYICLAVSVSDRYWVTFQLY